MDGRKGGYLAGWMIAGREERKEGRDFPGGPAVKTPHSQCMGPGFDPWSGN